MPIKFTYRTIKHAGAPVLQLEANIGDVMQHKGRQLVPGWRLAEHRHVDKDLHDLVRLRYDEAHLHRLGLFEARRAVCSYAEGAGAPLDGLQARTGGKAW